jgi:hypothetical protein
MLIDLASALAVRALDVRGMEAVGAGQVLDIELAYVRVDDHETLIDEQ